MGCQDPFAIPLATAASLSPPETNPAPSLASKKRLGDLHRSEASAPTAKVRRGGHCLSNDCRLPSPASADGKRARKPTAAASALAEGAAKKKKKLGADGSFLRETREVGFLCACGEAGGWFFLGRIKWRGAGCTKRSPQLSFNGRDTVKKTYYY
ncbi:hypothetical protein VPH35_058934 [Triticum aestivum]